MKSKIIAFALAVFGVATIGVSQLTANAAVDTTRDCDKYAVVYCGTMTPGEARDKYSQGDHAKVFQSMGISRADLSGSFRDGVIYQDGRVVVGGKTVATGARMAARHLGGTPIAGTSAAKVSVSKMGSAQTAMVKFDANGRFLFAIMKPCGNPVTATPPKPQPKPKAECKSLTQTSVTGTRRSYRAVATTANGATVQSFTFVATKDGHQINTQTVPAARKAANYNLNTTGPGNYTVQATAHTSLRTRSGPQCTQSFTIEQPPAPHQPGVSIEKFVGTDQKYKRVGVDVEYSYSIHVKNTGDVDLQNVVVSDTPDQGITLLGTSPTVGEIKDNTWVYTIPTLKVGETMTFTLNAKVPAQVAGKLVNTVCVDAPEVPGNPDDCDSAEVDVPGKIKVCILATRAIETIDEADFDSTIHSKNLEDCDVPEELPETGPTETVLQIVGAMSLVGASAYYMASRRSV